MEDRNDEKVYRLIRDTKRLEYQFKNLNNYWIQYNQLQIEKMSLIREKIFENITGQINSYQFNKLMSMANSAHKLVEKRFNEMFLISMKANNMLEARKKFIMTATKFMAQFADSFTKIQEIYENPNSNLNVIIYKNNLINFYWAMPYEITFEELFDIVRSVNSEKEFDDYMENYFTKNKMEKMFNVLLSSFSADQLLILKQSIFAYEHEQYALANMAVMALIDYSLSFLIKKESITSRYGILEPIINIRGVFSSYLDYIKLVTLSNNVNRIFEYVSSRNPKINGHKQARRNSSQHGYAYSNKLIDTIMFYNTLCNIVLMKPNLSKFEHKLIRINGNFVIDQKKKRKKKNIKKNNKHKSMKN